MRSGVSLLGAVGQVAAAHSEVDTMIGLSIFFSLSLAGMADYSEPSAS